MSANRLIIFVKAPRPGLVKSRLAATLGPKAAANAYCTLVETLLRNLTTLSECRSIKTEEAQPSHAGSQSFAIGAASASAVPSGAAFSAIAKIEIRFTPDDAFKEIQHWLQADWLACPQGSGDLGRRLYHAFVEAFAAAVAERVVIIGSDCPTVTADDIQSAWAALQANDVVLGPAADGGYWLIGLRNSQPKLFEHMNWSTATVLRETLKRAQELGLRVRLLSERSDIDTEKDWQEFLCANSAGTTAHRQS